jgi:uncharacterized protein (DUF608 family)
MLREIAQKNFRHPLTCVRAAVMLYSKPWRNHIQPLTAYAEANFADFLRQMGRNPEALPLAKNAWENLQTALPKNHRYVRWARAVLRSIRKCRPQL